MIVLLVFIGLIVGLNCIPLLTKANFPKTEKVIVKMLFISTILWLTFTILQFCGYRLKGHYSFLVIGLVFIVLTLIYFALFKNTKKKILTVFLFSSLLFVSVFILLSVQVLKEFRIDESKKIIVTEGGLLSCGETIQITESKFGLFDKEIHYKNFCLQGIEKIEVLKFNDKYAEFLIYHNGEMNSENPYKYEIRR